MEQRASSLQQRLEARRNMFLAQKSGEGGNSGPSSVGGLPSSYVASRTGKNIIYFLAEANGCGEYGTYFKPFETKTRFL